MKTIRIRILAPTDIEDMPVCTVVEGDFKHAAWQALPLEAVRMVEVEKGKKRESYKPRVEFLTGLTKDDVILAPLGGVGDAFLINATTKGAQVLRLPFNAISRLSGLEGLSKPPAALREGAKAAERCEQIARIATAYVNDGEAAFRPFGIPDVRIAIIRTYMSQLISLQDEIRKRLQQRTERLERDQEYLDVDELQRVLDVRVDWVSPTKSIDELLKLEGDLTKQIEQQLKLLPVYTEVLGKVKGIGPRLAARLIGPIVDIKRFPDLPGFIKYCGWSVMDAEKGTPHGVAAKFQRGQSAQFHELMRMGTWLFTQQIARNDSQFKVYSDGYKRKFEPLLGYSLYRNGDGKKHPLTKAMLNRRALRYAAGKMLRYLWYGWHMLEGRTFTHSHGSDKDKPLRLEHLLNPDPEYLEQLFRPVDPTTYIPAYHEGQLHQLKCRVRRKVTAKNDSGARSRHVELAISELDAAYARQRTQPFDEDAYLNLAAQAKERFADLI